jgi:bifunctional non-homologous end joining protein LigD
MPAAAGSRFRQMGDERGSPGPTSPRRVPNGKFTYIGGAGTGFSEKNAPGRMKRLRTMETAQMMFEANKPSRARDKHYCRPELVCEVAVEDWTGSGKLRQASFKGFREDKEPEEVVVEEP